MSEQKFVAPEAESTKIVVELNSSNTPLPDVLALTSAFSGIHSVTFVPEPQKSCKYKSDSPKLLIVHFVSTHPSRFSMRGGTSVAMDDPMRVEQTQSLSEEMRRQPNDTESSEMQVD